MTCVCCIKNRVGREKGAQLGGKWILFRYMSAHHQPWRVGSGWPARCWIRQLLAQRAHTFQIIPQLIGQTWLNYSRCAMQGVITTIRKMVTLRHAHLPSVLMNRILSPSPCSLLTAGLVNRTVRAAGRHLGPVCGGWRGTCFSLFFVPQVFFQKKKNK